jgi:hypothetical protein
MYSKNQEEVKKHRALLLHFYFVLFFKWSESDLVTHSLNEVSETVNKVSEHIKRAQAQNSPEQNEWPFSPLINLILFEIARGPGAESPESLENNIYGQKIEMSESEDDKILLRAAEILEPREPLDREKLFKMIRDGVPASPSVSKNFEMLFKLMKSPENLPYLGNLKKNFQENLKKEFVKKQVQAVRSMTYHFLEAHRLPVSIKRYKLQDEDLRKIIHRFDEDYKTYLVYFVPSPAQGD